MAKNDLNDVCLVFILSIEEITNTISKTLLNDQYDVLKTMWLTN